MLSALAVAGLVTSTPLVSGADAEPASPPPSTEPAIPLTNQVNQVDTVQLTRQMIEALQKEIAAQVARHTEAITASVMQIEPALNRIRQQQEEAATSANRTILIAAGLFAVAGFFGLGFLTLASVRAMSRFTDVAVGAAMKRPLPAPGETSPDPGFKPVVSGTVEQASARFQGALEQLERRILELEHTSHTTAGPSPATVHAASPSQKSSIATTHGSGNGPREARVLPDSAKPTSIVPHAAETDPSLTAVTGSTPGPSPSRAEMQLGKGQALLNLDKAAEALECFESALQDEPDNTDALLRKGMALEKLQDWERALDCYDRVIGLDSSITVAYLYKGGICNRLERHREALESYEQALHSERQRGISA